MNRSSHREQTLLNPIKQIGFTLLELLVSIAILSILLSIGLPSFLNSFEQRKLIAATESLYDHLQQARIESIARSDNVTLNFSGSGTKSWLYGYSQGINDCDLTKTAATDADACVVVINDGDATVHGIDGNDTDDLVLMRFTSADYDDVTLTLANFSNATEITFNPLRGISDSGDISLASDHGHKLKVKVSRLGLIKICSPDGSVSGYSSSSC